MDSFKRWSARSLVAFALLALLAAVGCGEEDPAAGLDFTAALAAVEEEEAQGGASEVAYDPFSRLTGHHERLLRISYTHDLMTLVREVTRGSRDIERLVDDSAPDSGLDWVVRVHDMHRASEELRIRAYGYQLDEALVLDYVDFHASFLEGVQVFAQSADRLLQAAIILGPSGRVVSDMPAEQQAEFMSLVGEAGFFYQDTEVLNTRAGEDLRELIGELHLR